MYDSQKSITNKKRVYASGGSVWAFYTLFNNDDSHANLQEFKLEDIYKYDEILKNNFEIYQSLATNNSKSLEYKNVVKI